MTKSTQKKKVKKLRFQTKAEKLVAEGGLYVPAPSRETWTIRMFTAFNGSIMKAKKQNYLGLFPNEWDTLE